MYSESRTVPVGARSGRLPNIKPAGRRPEPRRASQVPFYRPTLEGEEHVTSGARRPRGILPSRISSLCGNIAGCDHGRVPDPLPVQPADRKAVRQKTKGLLAPKSASQLICKENKTTCAIAVREGFGWWPRHNNLARILLHRRPTAIRCRSCFCAML